MLFSKEVKEKAAAVYRTWQLQGYRSVRIEEGKLIPSFEEFEIAKFLEYKGRFYALQNVEMVELLAASIVSGHEYESAFEPVPDAVSTPTKIEQRFTSDDQPESFRADLLRFLAAGWRIVPGSIYVTSYQREHSVYDEGNAPFFKKYFCATVEREKKPETKTEE